jgi:hypothetical protein
MLDRSRRDLAERVQAMKVTAEAVCKLREAGFDVSLNEWSGSYLDVTVKQEELTRVYRALGRLRKSHHSLEDAKKRTLRVTLKCEKYPRVSIQYVRKLPQGEKVKCKIVRKRVTQAQLVCEV